MAENPEIVQDDVLKLAFALSPPPPAAGPPTPPASEPDMPPAASGKDQKLKTALDDRTRTTNAPASSRGKDVWEKVDESPGKSGKKGKTKKDKKKKKKSSKAGE